MKSLYHPLEQDNNLQALNVSSALYHLTTVDPRAHMLTPDQLDDQPVYYQSRPGTLVNNPVLYHTGNQRYSNCSSALLSGSPMAPHPASAPSQCVSARTPVPKLGEGPQVGDSFDPYSMSRNHGYMQTALPLGKSPPLRYIQSQVQAKVGSRVDPGGQPLAQITPARGNHEERAPEKIMIKQENLSYAYLEDGEYNVMYCLNAWMLEVLLTFFPPWNYAWQFFFNLSIENSRFTQECRQGLILSESLYM